MHTFCSKNYIKNILSLVIFNESASWVPENHSTIFNLLHQNSVSKLRKRLITSPVPAILLILWQFLESFKKIILLLENWASTRFLKNQNFKEFGYLSLIDGPLIDSYKLDFHEKCAFLTNFWVSKWWFSSVVENWASAWFIRGS